MKREICAPEVPASQMVLTIITDEQLEAFADAVIAYAQLFDFSNYTYEPATEIVELRGPRAEKLICKL